MNDAVRDGINEQIAREFHAAYLYLSMSAWFETRSLDGCAAWMRAQAREEMGHAMRLFDHLAERGARIDLGGIDEPPTEFGSPVEAFQAALDHEKKVTQWIHELYDKATDEHDHAAEIILEWFIDEQVEEEDTIGTLVDQLRMAGDNQAAVLMLDRELGARGGGGEGGE